VQQEAQVAGALARDAGHGGLQPAHKEAEHERVEGRAQRLVEGELDGRVALAQPRLDELPAGRGAVERLLVVARRRAQGVLGRRCVVGREGVLEEGLPGEVGGRVDEGEEDELEDGDPVDDEGGLDDISLYDPFDLGVCEEMSEEGRGYV